MAWPWEIGLAFRIIVEMGGGGGDVYTSPEEAPVATTVLTVTFAIVGL